MLSKRNPERGRKEGNQSTLADDVGAHSPHRCTDTKKSSAWLGSGGSVVLGLPCPSQPTFGQVISGVPLWGWPDRVLPLRGGAELIPIRKAYPWPHNLTVGCPAFPLQLCLMKSPLRCVGMPFLYCVDRPQDPEWHPSTEHMEFEAPTDQIWDGRGWDRSLGLLFQRNTSHITHSFSANGPAGCSVSHSREGWWGGM